MAQPITYNVNRSARDERNRQLAEGIKKLQQETGPPGSLITAPKNFYFHPENQGAVARGEVPAPAPYLGRQGTINDPTKVSFGSFLNEIPGAVGKVGNFLGDVSGFKAVGEDIAAAIMPYTSVYKSLEREGKITPEVLNQISPVFKKDTMQVLGDFTKFALNTVGSAEVMGAKGVIGAAELGGKAVRPLLSAFGRGSALGGAYGAADVASLSPEERSNPDNIKKIAFSALSGGIIDAGTTAVFNKIAQKVLGTVPVSDLSVVVPKESPIFRKQQELANALSDDRTFKLVLKQIGVKEEQLSSIQTRQLQTALKAKMDGVTGGRRQELLGQKFKELEDKIGGLRKQVEELRPKLAPLEDYTTFTTKAGNVKLDVSGVGSGVTKVFDEAKPYFTDLETPVIKHLNPLQQMRNLALDADRATEKVDATGILQYVMYDNIDDAVNLQLGLKQQVRDKMTNDFQLRPHSVEGQHIFDYVERGGAVSLTPRERQTADWMRSQYDLFLGEINKTLEHFGRKTITPRANYITHIADFGEMFKRDKFNALFHGSEDRTTEEILAGIYAQPNAPKFKYAEKRTGALIPKRDAYEAMSAYADMAGEILYKLPAVNLARRHVKDLPPNAVKFFTQYLDTIGGKPTDEALFGAVATPWLSNPVVNTTRRWLGRALVSMNLHVAASQLTSIVPVMAEAGTVNTIKGITKMLTEEGRTASNASREVFFRKAGKLPGSELEQMQSSLMEALDSTMVKVGYMAGLEKGKAQGLAGEELNRFADRVARRTQAGYLQHQRPLIMMGKSGQTLMQFGTYGINLLNYMGHDMGALMRKDPIGALRKGLTFFVSAEMVNMAYNSAIGEKPYTFQSAIPSVLSKGAGSTPVGQLAGHAVQAAGVGTPSQVSYAQENLPGDLAMLGLGAAGLPGSQILKTGRTLKALGNNNTVYTPQGKKKFSFNANDPAELLRGLAFGPYGTLAGKKYIQEGKDKAKKTAAKASAKKKKQGTKIDFLQ